MSDGEKHTFIERAIADGYAELSGEGKTERVRYVAADRSERWSDPEEKVRAEFWAELIYKYDYSPDRIRLALQLFFCFEVRALSGSLVSSTPE